MSDNAPGTFTIGNPNWPENVRFQDFSEFLGLSIKKDSRGTSWSYGQKTIDKVNEIFTWGKIKSKSQNLEDIKVKVFGLKRKVGTNFVGETLVNQLWQSIFLDSRFKITDKDRERHVKVEKQLLQDFVRTGEEVELEQSKEVSPEKGLVSETKPIKEIEQSLEKFISPVKIKETNTKPIRKQFIKI